MTLAERRSYRSSLQAERTSSSADNTSNPCKLTQREPSALSSELLNSWTPELQEVERMRNLNKMSPRAILLESARHTTRVRLANDTSPSGVGTRVRELKESTRTIIFLPKTNNTKNLGHQKTGMTRLRFATGKCKETKKNDAIGRRIKGTWTGKKVFVTQDCGRKEKKQ